MHSTTNPATIIHGTFVAVVVAACSLGLLRLRLLLPLPIGCLASR
ncbi:MAG: hypothetical protein ABI656_03930 [bacterium]